MRWMLCRTVDVMRRRLEVIRLGLEYVWYERLRVAVDDWEPCALHLHHEAVSFEERVALRVQAERVLK